MASSSIPLLLLTLLFLASANVHNFPEIRAACQASQSPTSCVASLINTPMARKHPGAFTILRTAIRLSLHSVKKSKHMSESILSIAKSSNDFNLTVAARNGLEVLNASVRTISRSKKVAHHVGMRIKDARAWMSAAFTYVTASYSGFDRLNRSDLITIVRQLSAAVNLTSTALNMVAALDTYGVDIEAWRQPQTERSANVTVNISTSSDDEWLKELRRGEGEVVVNVTVSKEDDGSEYSSIQAAVDAAPDYSKKVYVIRIKAGVYEEIVRVGPSKMNIMWVGEGMDRTIVTGALNAQQPGVGTYGSATVGYVYSELTVLCHGHPYN